MADRRIRFNERAAVEAILYIVEKIQPKSGRHKTFKILYFAELEHLKNYGQFIVGDEFVARDHGPVPEKIYKMVGAVEASDESSYPEFTAAVTVLGRELFPVRKPDLDWLSESAIECLDASIAKYGHLSFQQLKRKSHGTAWESTRRKHHIKLDALVNEIGNPDGLMEHLNDPHP